MDTPIYVPNRQVRADYDDDSIVVYQAYSPSIACCGWATKPGQEHVLAIRITRAGFEWALANSAFAHSDSDCDEWITEIRDVTELARQCRAELVEHGVDAATKLLAPEHSYPVPDDIAERIGVRWSR